MLMILMSIWLFCASKSQAGPKPIQFSIPEIKIVKTVPQKTRDFAILIPGKTDTYIYQDEASYYKGYQDAYFAVTCKKGGWDCMRHYEILANVCIPLEGVSYLLIDHTKFDKTKYYEILHKLLEYTKQYVMTKNIAQYILNSVNYVDVKIFF